MDTGALSLFEDGTLELQPPSIVVAPSSLSSTTNTNAHPSNDIGGSPLRVPYTTASSYQPESFAEAHQEESAVRPGLGVGPKGSLVSAVSLMSSADNTTSTRGRGDGSNPRSKAAENGNTAFASIEVPLDFTVDLRSLPDNALVFSKDHHTAQSDAVTTQQVQDPHHYDHHQQHQTHEDSPHVHLPHIHRSGRSSVSPADASEAHLQKQKQKQGRGTSNGKNGKGGGRSHPPSPPGRASHQSAFEWAMQEIYNPQDPIALGPMRWNVTKLSTSYDTQLAALDARTKDLEHDLGVKHEKETAALKQRIEHMLAEEKQRFPVQGRLKLLIDSEANLRRLGRTKEADAVGRRIPLLEKKFWGEKLGGQGGFLERTKEWRKELRNRQKLEKAKVMEKARGEMDELRRRKDVSVKSQMRSNKKSFMDVWSLHYAAMRGEMDRLNRILERSVEKHMRESPDNLKVILRAIMEQRDRDTGRTPLHFAARNAQVKAADFLLKLGANPNALDPSGLTPLHLAAGWGSKEVCGLLLQRGGDKTIRARDREGNPTFTPYDIAKMSDRREIATFLDKWLMVGLTESEKRDLGKPEPLDAKQAMAKALHDERLYLQLRSLDMKEAMHGSNSVKLTVTLTKLADLYRQRDMYHEALMCLQKILEISEHNFGEYSRETSCALNNLGEVYFSLMRYNESLVCLQRAVAVADALSIQRQHALNAAAAAALVLPGDLASEEERKREQETTEVPARNLGLVYFRLGKLKEAEPLLRRYLKFQEARYAGELVGEFRHDGVELIPAVEVLAYCLLIMQRHDEALVLYRKARRLAAQAGGSICLDNTVLRKGLSGLSFSRILPASASAGLVMEATARAIGGGSGAGIGTGTGGVSRGEMEEEEEGEEEFTVKRLTQLLPATRAVARQLENEGMVHFCAGDFYKAEVAFRAAYDLSLESGCADGDATMRRLTNNMATVQCRRGGLTKF